MDENVWEEVIQVNPAQAAFLVMPYQERICHLLACHG